VAEEVEKEGIVPAGAFDLLAHRYSFGVSANDVDGEPPQNGEVLRAVVFSGSATVLVEHHIEHPMQAILDTPMTAHDLQHPVGSHVLGKKIIVHDDRLLGAPGMGASARGDARQRDHAGKAICRRHAGVANDGRATGLVAVVGRGSMLLATLRLPARAKRRATAANSFL
jgi:hypothetical protein